MRQYKHNTTSYTHIHIHTHTSVPIIITFLHMSNETCLPLSFSLFLSVFSLQTSHLLSLHTSLLFLSPPLIFSSPFNPSTTSSSILLSSPLALLSSTSLFSFSLHPPFSRLGSNPLTAITPITNHRPRLGQRQEAEHQGGKVQGTPSFEFITLTHSFTHSHTDGGVNHARQEPARQEQLG